MKNTALQSLINKIIIGFLISVCIFATIEVAQSQIQVAQAGDTLVPEVQIPTDTSGPSKVALVQNLPEGKWTLIVAGIIQLILGITGSLALVAFTVGGIMMITAQGNEEKVTKGKHVLLWSVLALIIIATSYAIVLGVTQLRFIE